MNDMGSYVAKGSVIKAEIIWVLKNVMSGFSLRSCDGISDCFKEMFLIVRLLIIFHLPECSCLITYGIAPYFASLLLEDNKHSDNFLISFEESLNSVTVNVQMDIVITFWDKLNSKVEVQYLASIFLGHTRADHLLKAFQEATSKLELDKILQVSIDGPSVNRKFYEKLIESQEVSELTGLINIGSCSLHIIH